MTSCPASLNLCIDENQYNTINPTNLCVTSATFESDGDPGSTTFADTNYYKNIADEYYTGLGGLGKLGPNSFSYPEFLKSSPGKYEGNDNCDAGGDICTGGNFNINNGDPLNVGSALASGYLKQKSFNYGDPFTCCLRDYQCTDGISDIYAPSCFSSDDRHGTCPASFRATDTEPCQYLTTQFCLGNYSEGTGDDIILGLGGAGLDFTALWINSYGGVDGDPTTSPALNSLPVGTRYKLGSANNKSDSNTKCVLDKNTGLPSSNTSATGSCPRSGLVSPLYDNNLGYKAADFFEETPPCQKIFWRTLYGNQPTFSNNFWRIEGNNSACPDGTDFCTETSVLPNSCSAAPFSSEPSPSGLAWAQQITTASVNKLKALGASIHTPANLAKDSEYFSKWLFPLCSNYPNICQPFLETECSTVTEAELKSNPDIRKWCGCYLPDSFYDKYTSNFINKECTPYCNSTSVIPLANQDGIGPQYCSQSVCIIDDVSISLAKTEFESNGGTLNFSQVCGSCGTNYQDASNVLTSGNSQNIQEGSTKTKNGSKSAFIQSGSSNQQNTLLNNTANITCNCRIENFTLQSLGASITGGINLSQSCAGNSKCYNTQTDPLTGQAQTVEVDCNDSDSSINGNLKTAQKNLEAKAKNSSNYIAVLIILISLALIIVLWIFFAERGVPEKDIYFSRKVPYSFPKTQINNPFKK